MLDVSDNGDSWRVIWVDWAELGDAGENNAVTGERWRRSFPNYDALPNLTKVAIAVISMRPPLERAFGYGVQVSKGHWWLDDNEDLLKEYENV